MKRFFSSKWAVLVVCTIFIASLGGIVGAATKDADYTLYYSDANKNTLKNLFNNGEKSKEIGNKLIINAKGDIFGEGVNFAFTEDINDQLNNMPGGADDASDNYYATTPVYCKDKKLSITKPSSPPYKQIDYTLGFHVNDWNNVQNNDSYKLYAGITKITEFGGAGSADNVVFKKASYYENLTGSHGFNPTKLGDGGDHGGNGGDAKDHIDSECFDALSKGSLGDSKLKNYYKLSDDAKKRVDAAMKKDPDSAAADDPDSATGGDTDDDIPCLGGALGYILCPLINVAADGIRAVSSFIDSMMQFRMLIGSDSGDVIRGVWGNFVGVANIILVIAFMIIIFSQSTSIGLSNYGIKKMLPKLVLAVIAINLSFYICAFVIDISNIVGNGILGLLSGQSTLDPSIREGIAKEANLDGPGSFQTIVGATLGVAIGVVLIILFITPLLLGVIITFVILVGRQVILLLLVIVSPIAFAAWLLPNTEQYFKKWKDLFQSMLLAYPIVMLVFGAALLSADVISTTAKVSPSDTDVSNAVAGDALASIISLLVLAIPLIAMPFILKSSSSMLGRLGNLATKYGGQQIAGKAGGATKGAIARAPGIRSGFEMMEQRKANMNRSKEHLKTQRAARRASRGGVRAGIVGGAGLTQASRHARQSLDSNANAMLEALESKQIEETMKGISTSEEYKNTAPQNRATFLESQLAQAAEQGDTAKAKALQNMLVNQGSPGMAALRRQSGNSNISSEMHAELANNLAEKHYPTLESKAPDLLNTYAMSGGVQNVSAASASNYGKVKAETIKDLDATALDTGLLNGGISDDTAREALNNENIRGNLTEAHKQRLRDHLGGTGGPTPQPSPAGGGSPSGPTPIPPQPSPTGGAPGPIPNGSSGSIPVRGQSAGGVVLPNERRTRDSDNTPGSSGV